MTYIYSDLVISRNELEISVIHFLISLNPVFEIRGGGGGRGVKPITAQDPGICAFQGDPGWNPKRPPPPKYKKFSINCFKALKHH